MLREAFPRLFVLTCDYTATVGNVGMEYGVQHSMVSCQTSGLWNSCVCCNPYYIWDQYMEYEMVGNGMVPHYQSVRLLPRSEGNKGGGTDNHLCM